MPDEFTIYDGSSYEVLERPDSLDGALVMRFRLVDGCGAPPPHVHPETTEVFEVEEGSFEMLVGDEWRTVPAGESVTVPPGMKHTFRNRSGNVVVIRNVHEPHHDFEAYLRALGHLSHELKATGPTGPRSVIAMARLWQKHSDLIAPADLPMKVALPVLAAAGRLLRVPVPSA